MSLSRGGGVIGTIARPHTKKRKKAFGKKEGEGSLEPEQDHILKKRKKKAFGSQEIKLDC
jgi:hypothetical protein